MAKASHLSPVRTAKSDDSDPIFAVIERHLRAHAIWSAALDRDVEGVFLDKASVDRDKAICDLTEIYPTTVAGVVALLRHYERYEEDEEYWGDDFGVAIAGHAAAALERIARL
jgi:hypothetical protein